MVSAQTISTFAPKITNIPSSPEAALFQRFGDIPVGYYTGTANISIPIYTIKEGGLEIPIELRYNSSGIRVSDEATWVGLGWDLTPGGAIVQEVKGQRDDEDPFYYPTQPEGYEYLKSKILANGPAGLYKLMWRFCGAQADELPFYQAFQEVPYSTADYALRNSIEAGGSQPDIYNFSFAGYSGQFYINFETKQIEQIDKKEEIFFEHIGDSFTATTQDGNIFHFNVVENAYNYNSSVDVGNKAGRTFRLGSINFFNGQRVDFSYTTVSVSSRSYSESRYIVQNCSNENANLGLKETLIQSTSKVLTQISTKDAVIDFVLEDREDLIGISIPGAVSPKRLQKIDIYSKFNSPATNKKIRSFAFNYSYFPYNQSLGVPGTVSQPIADIASLGKRLKLDSLKEIGYDAGTEVLTKPAYKFEYDLNVSMPLKTSCSKDFWGYFNGENNTSLLPNLEYFDFEHDIDYMQNYFYTQNGEVHMIYHHLPFQYNNYVSGNRYVNPSTVGTYMLNKIVYPTGGSTKFTYESNTFENQFVPTKVQESIAKKQFALDNHGQGNQQVNYQKKFVLSKTTTVTFHNSMNDGYSPQTINNPNAPVYPLNAFSGSKIIFSKVKVLPSGQSQTTIIKEWQANDLGVLTAQFETDHYHNWDESFRIDYDPDISVYYAVDVINTLSYSNDTYHIAAIKANFRFYDDTGINTSISYGAGVRIKAIKNFSEKGVLISDKVVNYSNGKLLNRFRPMTSKDSFCASAPPFFTNGQPVQNVSMTNPIFISSDGLIQNSGKTLGYGTVEEKELGNASGNNGKKVFNFRNFENLNYRDAPTIVEPLNGLPLYDDIYDAAGNLKYKKIYNYLDLYVNRQNKYFYGTINIHLLSGFASYCTADGGAIRDYMLITYPIISTWYKLESITTRNYFGNDFVSETENYTYNTFGNIKNITKLNSNNEELITQYFYPTDTPVMVNQSLINNHMTGVVLTTKQFNGTSLLSTTRTDYDVFGNLLMPKSIYASKGNAPEERKISFDSYDSKGNVLQYTMENGAPIAFKWDSMQSIILAKAENSTYQLANSVGFLQGNLPNAMVTLYETEKLIGVTKITNPNGAFVFYEYDAFGQLKTVKDRDQKILSEHEYHYLPQN